MKRLGAVRAFVLRDARLQASLRLGLLIGAAGAVLNLAPFFFIGRLIQPSALGALTPYGGDYFAFVLLGLAAARYVNAALSGFAGRLRAEQEEGTLESLIASPLPFSALIAGSLAWELIWATAEVLLYVAAGLAFFSFPAAAVNVPSLLLVMGLGLACLSGLGLFAACGVLMYKEADPVGWGLSAVMRFAGGVYFPVSLLPGWVQGAANCLPLTHVLEALRQSVLMGRSPGELWPQLGVLAVFALVLWPAGVLAFKCTIEHLRRQGTLSFR